MTVGNRDLQLTDLYRWLRPKFLDGNGTTFAVLIVFQVKLIYVLFVKNSLLLKGVAIFLRGLQMCIVNYELFHLIYFPSDSMAHYELKSITLRPLQGANAPAFNRSTMQPTRHIQCWVWKEIDLTWCANELSFVIKLVALSSTEDHLAYIPGMHTRFPSSLHV